MTNQEILQGIDNMGLLLLDIVWCVGFGFLCFVADDYRMQ